MTPEQIKALRAAAESATKGRWHAWGGTATYAVSAQIAEKNYRRVIGCDLDASGATLPESPMSEASPESGCYNAGILSRADALYIEMAQPESIIALLDYIGELEARLPL